MAAGISTWDWISIFSDINWQVLAGAPDNINWIYLSSYFWLFSLHCPAQSVLLNRNPEASLRCFLVLGKQASTFQSMAQHFPFFCSRCPLVRQMRLIAIGCNSLAARSTKVWRADPGNRR
jgi:hypothetical protein